MRARAPYGDRDGPLACLSACPPSRAAAEPIRPRLHCDLAPPISYVWEHTGAWEQSPFEKPGKLAWSCCMCGEKDSKGCKSKQMRLEGWQYVSYG